MLDNSLRHRSEPDLSRELWKGEHGETIAQFRVKDLEVAVAFDELPCASPAGDLEGVRGVILKILRSNDANVKHATCSRMLD
jgi:hypothetical protein